MKRLRLRLWSWLFDVSVRFSNYALECRCLACGCPACLRVAHISKIFREAGSTVLPGRGLIDNAGDHDARAN